MKSPGKEAARTLNLRRQGGFTLIELLVALGLAAIIALCIARVGSQAEAVYVAVTAKVDLYQRMRFALTDLHETVENWLPTADLEFFVDQAGQRAGHWNEGEEINSSENLDGGRKGYFDEAPLLIEEQYTAKSENHEVEHDSFLLYFKSTTQVAGKRRVANVEYYLRNPEAEGKEMRARGEILNHRGLVLVKAMRWLETEDREGNKKDDFLKTKRVVKYAESDLCQNVTDFRVEYFYDNLYDNKPGGFLTPRKEAQGGLLTSEQPPREIKDAGIVKEFIYGGFRNTNLRATALAAKRDVKNPQNNFPVRFGAGVTGSGVNFSDLNYGDTIYVWKDRGAGEFPDGDYTVFRHVGGQIEFFDQINSSAWEGEQAGLRYKAARTPSAIRITLRVLDEKGRDPSYLPLVVHPFRKKSG